MKKILAVATIVVLIIGLCVLGFYSYEQRATPKGTAALTAERDNLSAERNGLAEKAKTLTQSMEKLNESFVQAKRAHAEAKEKNIALQTELDDHQKWFQLWKVAKSKLEKAEKNNSALGDLNRTLEKKVKVLEGEKDKLQKKYSDLLIASKATLGEKLAALKAKTEKEAAEAEKKKLSLKAEIKKQGGKIRELERKLASSKPSSLEAILAKTNGEKLKSAANSFRVWVTLTAVSIEDNLIDDIRDPAAFLMVAMQSRSDEEFFAVAQPIMAKMPKQDDIDCVSKLHSAWTQWVNLQQK